MTNPKTYEEFEADIASLTERNRDLEGKLRRLESRNGRLRQEVSDLEAEKAAMEHAQLEAELDAQG